ncbi:MAG: hypothetical protein ABSB31_01725 [Dehalococcoidia bacterium]|jgi:hypothetical protein
MGHYYKDSKELYDIYGHLMERLLTDEKIGPKFGSAGIIIKFIYTDPDAEITIDLKNPPSKPGYYGSYYLGPCNVKEDVWSKQSADFSHSFWHGYENPVAAVAKGKISQGGNIVAMLKLLPVIKPAFVMFPKVLVDMGRSDLVIQKK